MRASVNKEDKGYVDDSYNYQVYFNGELTDNVVTADEEEGFVLAFKNGEDGKGVINQAGTNFETEVLYGEVEIKKNE